MPMDVLEQATQALSIQGSIVPGTTLNSSSANTAGINAKNFVRLMAEVSIGAVASGGSVTAVLQCCSTVGGSYVSISGSTLTLTLANLVNTLEIRADEIPTAAGNVQQPFIRVLLTETAGHNVAVACTLWGCAAPYRPASQFDVAGIVGQRTVSSI